MRTPAFLLLLAPLLSGCVAAAVGAGTEAGISLAEERSVGRKVDDIAIYSDINRLYLKDGSADLFGGVTVDVRHARVLLTGIVGKTDTAQKAVSLAWQARGVEEVINEIMVKPGSDFATAAEDTFTKKNLEARLLVTKNVWVINYSLNVVEGTAYLLGRVKDQAELDRVLNIARTTKGIKRVVNYLQIRPQNDPTHPAVSPYASQQTNSSPAPVETPSSNYSAPAPSASSGGAVGGDGYAAPELITSQPLPAN
jgi:osmotically-inducible protein OsmY